MEQSTFSHFELINKSTDRFGQQLTKLKSASQWFCNLFPQNAKIYGAPFLENRISSVEGFSSISPVEINVDFMASILGGDYMERAVIYWPAECQFYYFDHSDQLYHSTTDEKLGDVLRGYLARCSLEMQREVNVYYLFTTFRSDQIIKSVVERAKSVLRTSDDFFSATSPCARVNGIEQHERLARTFCERVLVLKPSEVMLMAVAYERFTEIVKQNEMVPIKRSEFKEMMKSLVRDRFNISLRNDLVVDGRYQQGWKDLTLNSEVVME
jgi:hypothetical protein